MMYAVRTKKRIKEELIFSLPSLSLFPISLPLSYFSPSSILFLLPFLYHKDPSAGFSEPTDGNLVSLLFLQSSSASLRNWTTDSGNVFSCRTGMNVRMRSRCTLITCVM